MSADAGSKQYNDKLFQKQRIKYQKDKQPERHQNSEVDGIRSKLKSKSALLLNQQLKKPLGLQFSTYQWYSIKFITVLLPNCFIICHVKAY